MSDTIEVKRVRVPNEFLVRFDVHGVPTGAHLVMLSYLQSGNEIMQETMRLEHAAPAEWSSAAVAKLLGDYGAYLSAELAATQAELDEALAQILKLTESSQRAGTESKGDNGRSA